MILWPIDPYTCTGKFSDDFQAMCKQSQISYAPIIVQRQKVPQAQIVVSEVKVEKGKPGRKGTQSNLDSQSDLIPTISFAQNAKNQQQQQQAPQQSNISNEQDLGKFLLVV